MSHGIGWIFLLVIVAFLARTSAYCNGDLFAEPGCKGNFCGQRCFQTSTLACPHACIEGGCRCIVDYKYDTNLKICVPEKDCTAPINDPNY